MYDTEVITWRFQTLQDCITIDGPFDATLLERVQVACGDIKQVVSLWDRAPSSSSAPPWSVIDSLKETCVQYCQQCLDSQENKVNNIKFRIIVSVYDVTVLYARCLPVVWQLDAVLECALVLLKMHALISGKKESHFTDGLDDFMAYILDELIELLPFMDQLSRDLIGGLQLPDFWFEAIIRGHLALAKEAEHEVIQCNALSTVEKIFHHVASIPSLRCELSRLATLCTEHHYDMAVTLSLREMDAQTLVVHPDAERDSPGSRKCLHHCHKALSYGQIALENTEKLEHRVELEFVLKELVLLKATCLVNANELQEASKELSTLPDWSGEDDPVYYNLHLDFLLLQMRLQTQLDDIEQAAHYLRSLAVFAKHTQLHQSVRTVERMGRTIINLIHIFGRHTDTKQRLQIIDAVVFFMQKAGVSAMMQAIKALPKRLQNTNSSCLSLFFDIITNNTVCVLIRREDAKNQDICWDAFQQMAHLMLLGKDIDTCIKFAQALLHYGPEKKTQHAYAILFALYVYSRNYTMAEYCRKKLGSSLKQHPFVMGIMLLEELEAPNSLKRIEDVILKDISQSPEKWTEESVQAIRGIGEIYARKNLQRLGMESHISLFQTLKMVCSDESKSIDDVIDSMERILRLGKQESLKAVPSKAVLDGFRAVLLGLENKTTKNSSCAIKLFDTALSAVNIGRSIVGKDSWALKTLGHFEFCLRILQCHEYVNHLGDIEINKLFHALEECKKIAPADEQSNQAIALLQVRLSVLTNMPIVPQFDVVEQLLGDTYFVEFISVHMSQSKVVGRSLPKGLLEHMSASGIALDRLLISVSQRVDDNVMFGLYSRIVQAVETYPRNIGRDLFAISSQRLRSKLRFLMPSLFPPALGETPRTTEETSLWSCGSTISEYSSDSSAVDSPPAKRQTVAEADDLVSSLIRDLADEGTIGSDAAARQGIWSKWIKKVLG